MTTMTAEHHETSAAHGHEPQAGPHVHEDHAELLDSLNPAPSYWPFILAMTLALLPAGALFLIWGGPDRHVLGLTLVTAGALLSLFPAMGWFNSVIRDKWLGHFGPIAQGNDLTLGLKLFFLSEIAIFGSLFAYLYIFRFGHHWTGRPHINTSFPAVATLLLLSSSVTCEIGHKALLKARRGLCKSWLLLTIVLGTAFLAMQGFEWGFMSSFDKITPSTDLFGTLFYIMTGFHGMHVMTGVIMLILVYGRLEIGHFSPTRHFSMNAASWYWHLVDVIWIFLFFSLYLI